mgnify:CR=1 FL=1
MPCRVPSVAMAVATAWALKDACYAAWSSQPQRAGPAAQAVAGLLARVAADARALSAGRHELRLPAADDPAGASSQIAGLLGFANEAELIHRDNMVLV